MNAVIIPKEEIHNFQFVNQDVISNPHAKEERFQKLIKAMKLGNSNRVKVAILFKTIREGLMKVETTIWSVGGKYITIKGNRLIPINSIVDVRF